MATNAHSSGFKIIFIYQILQKLSFLQAKPSLRQVRGSPGATGEEEKEGRREGELERVQQVGWR